MAPIQRFKACGALSLLVVVAQCARLAPLSGLNGPLPAGLGLRCPFFYNLLAPWSAAADRLCLLSVAQLQSLLLWLVVLGLAAALSGARGKASLRAALGGALRRGLLFAGAVLLFFAWTLWWERPMAALSVADPELLAVNFHSHTRFSWDGRKGDTPADNMRWHRAAGFDAAFITDHDSLAGSEQGRRFARDEEDRAWGRYALSGAELGLSGLHLVELGCADEIDRTSMPGESGIPFAVKQVHDCGGAAVASLPEYWLYHWGEGLQALADAGVDGFEILNATPKGLAFPAADREKLLAFCRERRLPTVAVTDNHGWGAAVPGWNLMRIPGWRNLSPGDLQREIVRQLRQGGAEAVRVAARPRLEPAGRAALLFDPPLELLELLRSLTALQAASCLCWVWLLPLLGVSSPRPGNS